MSTLLANRQQLTGEQAFGALPRKRGRQAHHRASRRDSSGVPGEQPPLTKAIRMRRLLLWTNVYRVIKFGVVHRITPD